jgi:hypothetical protein
VVITKSIGSCRDKILYIERGIERWCNFVHRTGPVYTWALSCGHRGVVELKEAKETAKMNPALGGCLFQIPDVWICLCTFSSREHARVVTPSLSGLRLSTASYFSLSLRLPSKIDICVSSKKDRDICANAAVLPVVLHAAVGR